MYVRMFVNMYVHTWVCKHILALQELPPKAGSCMSLIQSVQK